jgi:hypothetical protein
MKIIRVFPRRTSHTPTDDLVFIGEPPMMRPEADEVHVSCTFIWDKTKAEHLRDAWAQYYPVVKLGGPAYDDPGNGFTPGLYLKSGITITSRGCNNKCPWCIVPEREGKIRELNILPGNIIQDNNLLQCERSHIDKVLDMLAREHTIRFTGGLEASRITQSFSDRLRGLRVKEVFLACDTDESIKPLRRAMKLLQLPRDKARCYVLLKYNPDETMLHAVIRLLEVWEAGFKPFAQLYQPPDKTIRYPLEWQRFVRTFQRPAATAAFIKTVLTSNIKGLN